MLKVKDDILKCEVTSLKVSRMLIETNRLFVCPRYARVECKGGNYMIVDVSNKKIETIEEEIKEGFLIPAFDVALMNDFLLHWGNVFTKKGRGIYEVRLEANDCSELYFGSARYLPDAMGMCMLNYIRAKKVEDGKD